MTFRKSILAGLVAALTLPVVAHAASSGPTRHDLEQHPTLKNTRLAEPVRNVTNSRNRIFDPREVVADKAWSDRHLEAMRHGADHMQASIAAGQR